LKSVVTVQFSATDLLPERIADFGHQQVRRQQDVLGLQELYGEFGSNFRNKPLDGDARVHNVPVHRRRSSRISSTLSVCFLPLNLVRIRPAARRNSAIVYAFTLFSMMAFASA